MTLISQKTAGWSLLIGLGAILSLNILLIKPFSFGIFLTSTLLIITIFLYQPLWGTGLFLIIRPLLDNWGENFNLKITENFSLNLNALLGILAVFLFSIFIFKNKKTWKNIPFKKSWLGLILFASVSLFYSLNFSLTAKEIIRLISIFLIFSTVFILAQKPENNKKLFFLISISSIIPFLTAFWQILSQTGLGGTLGLDGRLYGTFSHPNTFASFILIIFALNLILFFQEKKPQKRKFFLFLTLVPLFLLLETFSRGAWLALCGFLFVLAIYKSPKIIFISSLIFILVFSFSEDFRFRLQDVYNPSFTSSIQWRFDQWQKGIASWKKNFWQGWGAGTETLVFENQYGFYVGNPYTHNDFLRIGIEMGMLGLILYLLLIANVLIFLFFSMKKIKNKNSETKLFLILAFSIFLAKTIFSLSSNLFRATAVQWILWSFLAIALAKKE